MRVRVVKVGGSLLDLPDLGLRLRQYLSCYEEDLNLLVVGGGEIVESIRRLDKTHRFDSERVHWMCVELLNTTAAIMKALEPSFSTIRSPDLLQNVLDGDRGPDTHIVWVDSFYSDSEHMTQSLPMTWATTTDSIAAYLSVKSRATELVLLKSRVPRGEVASVKDLQCAGLVDEAFHLLANEIPKIRMIDLRSGGGCEIRHSV